MKSHTQTRLIDILSLPRTDTELCQISRRFAASTLFSIIALAHPVLDFDLVPQPCQ